jgi:ElaB/YqjD/DUF883 family membrane-anchored ribosome-binding protein
MPNAAEKAALSDNGSRTTQSLEADIEQLKAEIAKLTKQLQATGEQSIGTARRAAAESVGQLRAQGEAALEKMRSSAGDLESQLEESVREKPLTALGIAVGVGFLLALMTRR